MEQHQETEVWLEASVAYILIHLWVFQGVIRPSGVRVRSHCLSVEVFVQAVEDLEGWERWAGCQVLDIQPV